MPPKLQSMHLSKQMEGEKVQLQDQMKDLTGFYEIVQRLELNRNMFHCFNEVDTLKELSSGHLVSWFKELDTRQGTLL